jgi:hypothetical protein
MLQGKGTVDAVESERSLATIICTKCHEDAIASLKHSVHFGNHGSNPRTSDRPKATRRRVELWRHFRPIVCARHDWGVGATKVVPTAPTPVAGLRSWDADTRKSPKDSSTNLTE